MGSLSGRTVVLGVSGSIAAYKAPDVVRRFRDQGAEVHCVMTASSGRFIGPLTLAVLSGHPVAQDAYDPKLWEMAHLDLAKKANLVVVAPCSANTLARFAQGLADDLLTQLVLATKAPVLLAPAMHDTMWEHPLTQANVATLKKTGYHIVGPVKGKLADNQTGIGRLASTEEILEAASSLLK